jgi:hypothetical protein
MGFGSAANIYITQDGSSQGACTANVQTPAFFNDQANWGTGASQIGPGTTVLLCGTFTSSEQGGNLLTTQGNGSSGNPITILFDTNAQLNSTGWWGSASGSGPGTGAITILNDFITVNGGANGLIQNALAGCVQGATNQTGNWGTPGGNAVCAGGVSATCSGGTCTQTPGTAGSIGVAFSGDHIIIENLTIKGIYINAGNSISATDSNGENTVGINGTGTNIQIANNTITNSSVGINFANPGGSGASTGPNNCPGSGVCIYGNQLTDHHWQIAANLTETNTGGAVNNLYGNTMGDIGSSPGWLNWAQPTGQYHLDGIISFGYNHHPVTDYIFSNYASGLEYTTATGGNSTGYLYCSSTQLNDSSGSICYFYNNVLYTSEASALSGQIVIGGADRCKISSWSITDNVLTLNSSPSLCSSGYAWSMPVGEPNILTGFVAGSFLNNQTITITSLTSTQLTANFTHANASGTESLAYAYDSGNEGPYYIFNNTFIAAGAAGGAYLSGLVNYTYYDSPAIDPPYYTLVQANNIFVASPTPDGSMFESASNGLAGWTSITSNNNLYWNDRASENDLGASSWWAETPGSPNTAENNLAVWQKSCGCDLTSSYENPLVNDDGTLQTGSPAVGFGMNLTSLGIDSLNYDKAGNARPSSGGWDAGAYEHSSSSCPQAIEPSFSPRQGSYIGAQLVTISSTSSGAIICYNTTGAPATNGSTGCTTGTLYSGPVSVATSETLYAVAGGTGFTDSSVGSAIYTITPVSPTFTLSASTPAAIAPGAPATLTVTVSTTTGYVGTVTLTCALTSSPTGATDLPICSSGSSTVTLTSGATTGTATVTVTSTGASSELVLPYVGGKGRGWAGGGTVLALLVLLVIPERWRSWRAMLSVLALMVALGSLTACAGGSGGSTSSNQGTTAGSYTFTVSGTGNPSVTPAPTTTFTLTVD